MKKDRTGETVTLRDGTKATITQYNSSRDVSVRFEDGQTRDHITYGNLVRMKTSRKNTPIADHVGERKKMKNGLMCEIIDASNTAKKIKVRFENGEETETWYQSFRQGTVKAGSIHTVNEQKRKERVGSVSVSQTGQKMTLIRYRTARDIDVIFEDGTVVTNKRLDHFLAGRIQNPNHMLRSRHIGETQVNKQGKKMTVISCPGYNTVRVAFEDGTEAETSYNVFKNGNLTHPGERKPGKGKKKLAERVGQRKVMNNGLECAITEYVNSYNIMVTFEDGKTVNTSYARFLTGDVGKKPGRRPMAEEEKSGFIGKKATANNGQAMVIIAFRKPTDIDVEFEDGTIVRNKSIYAFRNGQIKNPNVATRRKKTTSGD